jgi:hypothetical protein
MKYIYCQTTGDAILALDSINSEYSIPYNNEDFIKPKVNLATLELYEGANQEEIEAKNQEIITTLINRINVEFTKLRQRALASSIGKPLSFGWDYIKEQSEQYRDKYHVAKGTIVNTLVSQMIADESNDFGITEEQMKAMIVQRFEAGENAYLQFTAMVERGRTKALTFVENNDFQKAETVISIMETVPEALTMGDAILLSNSLMQV